MASYKVGLVLLITVLCCILHNGCGLGPPQCPPGRRGEKGEAGFYGPDGITGDKGVPADTSDPAAKCTCRGPKGSSGLTGEVGDWGEKGNDGRVGRMGPTGERGRTGAPGERGPPGKPLNRVPATSDDTNFLAVTVPRRLPATICQYFKRHAYVPNVPNKWLAWYETGQSSYSIYKDWMYFTTKFVCPCKLPVPKLPTPSLSDMLKRL